MKRVRLAISLALLSPSLLVQPKAQNSRLPAYEDTEGYAVRSAILNRLVVARRNETTRIGRRSPLAKYVSPIKTQCSGVPEEFQSAWQDFDHQLSTRFMFQRRFSLSKSYELSYSPHLAASEKAETRGEARIRSGAYYVAPVGFDERRTRAVAFVEYICGSLCGDSIFYFLRKSAKGRSTGGAAATSKLWADLLVCCGEDRVESNPGKI